MLRWILPLLILFLTPLSASAGQLSAVLGDLDWGMSSDEVLDDQRERLLIEYRTQVEGLSDPLEIDGIRRRLDDRFDQIRATHEVLETSPTGYEASILGTEVRAGAGLSVLTARIDDLPHYWIFRDDRLEKLIVGFDVASLDHISFEGFLDRMAQLFGNPEESEVERDHLGRNMMVRAIWQDERTRLRVEDRRNLFQTYALVYSDASRPDAFVRHEEQRASRGTGRASGIMQRLSEEGESGTPSGGGSAADGIIGSSTDIQLRLRQDEREAEEREAREAEEEEEARREEEEERAREAAERERQQRRAPSSTPARERERTLY